MVSIIKLWLIKQLLQTKILSATLAIFNFEFRKRHSFLESYHGHFQSFFIPINLLQFFQCYLSVVTTSEKPSLIIFFFRKNGLCWIQIWRATCDRSSFRPCCTSWVYWEICKTWTYSFEITGKTIVLEWWWFQCKGQTFNHFSFVLIRGLYSLYQKQNRRHWEKFKICKKTA